MSSTNRGYNRHKSDYYVTPTKAIRDFLSNFQNYIDLELSDKRIVWLDPCAGGDEYNPPSYTTVITEDYDPYNVTSIDIREDAICDINADYLNIDYSDKDSPDIIISNPPFYLGMEFIKKSLEVVDDGGYVIMLLRLNFFGSKSRKPFFNDNMPKYCFIHHRRISFMKGATDSIEYAHFVWQKGYNKDYTKTILI